MSLRGFPSGSDGEESACSAGTLDLIPVSGRAYGEGNGYPLQYSCLENPMDRGAWWTTVHGVTKSQTWLSDFFFHFRDQGLCLSWLSQLTPPLGIFSLTIRSDHSLFWCLLALQALLAPLGSSSCCSWQWLRKLVFFAKKYVPVFHLVEDSHLFFFFFSRADCNQQWLSWGFSLLWSCFFFFPLGLKGLSCFMICGKVEVDGWIGWTR